MSAGYKGTTTIAGGTYYAPKIPTPVPDTWQSYLCRFSNGLNGVVGAGGTPVSEEDIVANAEKYMQKKYPGNYTVEQYYNADKMKWDLRLKFDDPKDKTMWLLRWG